MIWVTFCYLVELDYVGMADKLQDLDLPGDSFDVTFILNFLFLQDLDRDFFLGGHVETEFHLTEGALAELITWMRKAYKCRSSRWSA